MKTRGETGRKEEEEKLPPASCNAWNEDMLVTLTLIGSLDKKRT